MPAYIVAHVVITDWDAYREYMRHTPRVISQFGGKFIARGGETLDLEGHLGEERLVLIEFPDLLSAQKFYDSPEYQSVKKLRGGAGTAKFIAIEGYELSEWAKDVEESNQLDVPI